MTRNLTGDAAKGPELIICPAQKGAWGVVTYTGGAPLPRGFRGGGIMTGRTDFPVPADRRGKSPFGERFTRRDEIIVTEPQLAVLEALRDAPERAFATQRAWVQTSLGLLPGGRTGRHRVVRRMPEAWVARVRCGSRHLCVLQPRGLDVVEGRLPVWLFGAGPYAGLAHPRPGGVVGGRAGGDPPHASTAPAEPARARPVATPAVGPLMDRPDHVQAVRPDDDGAPWWRFARRVQQARTLRAGGWPLHGRAASPGRGLGGGS